ncbi:MAG: DUF2723 domain-containing protein [Ardenticatenales bacterium]|nr:DUF2723 domain-containing protein [Ardenticatenales bacterium]
MKRIAIAAARPGVRRTLFWLTLLAIGLTVVPTGAQPADSGEFQLVARDLGVAHPPGYPLYTMAAHLFGRVVLAIPPLRGLGWPWAVNAFSMVLAVATLAVVARTAARLGGTWVAGAVAATLLAFAPTFAAQALVANIRMGTGLFTAVVLGLTLSWLAEGGGGSRVEGDRTLVALCFVGALAAGHHPTLAALAMPLGLAIVARRPAVLRDARLIAQCLAAALVGLLPLAYLPIRAAQGAPLAPSDLATAGGVWRHVSAAGFRGDMLAITGAQDLGDRLLVLANILQLQFTPLALALVVIGAIWLLARRRAEAVALLGTTLIVAWLAITYRAPQTMEYLLPVYVALAIMAGAAVRPIPQNGPALRVARDVVVALAYATIVVQLMSFDGLRHRVLDAVPRLGDALTIAGDPKCLPSDATVLASWHFATPLWLTGRRAPSTADTTGPPYTTATGAPIVYVHPDFATGDPIGVTWRKAAQSAISRGPAVLTNRTRELDEADLPFDRIPQSGWWRSPAPGGAPSACVTDRTWPFPLIADLDDGGRTWTISGASTHYGDDRRVVVLTVSVPADATTNGVVAFAQIVGAGGVVAQADRPLGASRVAADGAQSAFVELPLAAFRGLGHEAHGALNLGLYRMMPEGPRRMNIARILDGDASVADDGTAIRVASSAGEFVGYYSTATPAGTFDAYSSDAPPDGAVPFGNAMSLLKSTIRRNSRDLTVDLTWRADLFASLSDYTVSVQAAAADATWRAQHDGTPALGAIPTLKWLPGMIIRDRHRILLPPEAAGHVGPYTVTVGVYDAFSLEPLPVTDGELVRQGQGQRAVVFESP